MSDSSKHSSLRCAFRLTVSLLAVSLAASPGIAQQRDTAPQKAPAHDPLRFEMMGPAVGGRVAAIAGVPGDASTWYIGNASGGVWKSSDSGSTFHPVFDKEKVQAIGALAVAPSNPKMVWAGTGEAWAIRDADVMGDGIYLSTDSGATWKNMGLRETGRIGRIIVNPTNPDIVFACALGRATGPQQERGVYRTTDGGATWQRVLFVDPGTGCSGLTLDAHDPNVLFAGMWQVEMHTWAMFGGGESSGIYASRDGGTTWKKVVHPGLPNSPLGKIDVAIAPTDSKRIYALIQTADQGSLWRSDDGGVSWHAQNWMRSLIGRGGYYIRLAVGTGNADYVLVANSSFFRSTDGGKTFAEVPWGGDNHDIWIDPKQPDRMGITDDAGARLTINAGKSWTNVGIANGQMYHVAVDNQVPYWIYSNRQDNGTMRGPSTTPEAGPMGRMGPPQPTRIPRGAGGDTTLVRGDSTARSAGAKMMSATDSIARADSVAGAAAMNARFSGPRGSTWDHGLGGCESGFTLPDPTDPDVVWASCYGNTVTRWAAKTKLARSVSPWIHTLDSPPNELKYRCHWTPPLAIDPFNPNTVYYGCQVVFKTSNGGQDWKVISPDLSTRDTSRIVSSGGIVPDNLGQFYGEVVFAIAPSEIRKGLIWAGTNDGKLWYTRDGGGAWTDVTTNMKGVPAWGTIRKIEPSHFDPATAYVAIDYHMMDDRKPYIYKTTNYGQTWTSVTGDLPTGHPLDYVMAITENPNMRGMLFTGTGHGFYYSRDDGAHWKQFSEGLPAAPVTWIIVPKLWHDVVVSTYGRGLFILKDITPLEQGTASPTAALTLYRPHAGYREARSGHADITFSAPSKTERPVTLEIRDSSGATIRTLRVATRAGYNRASWDLRYDPPTWVDLRTTPLANPHIWEEPRFKGKTVRPITHWGIQGPEVTGPLATPGLYSVRLLVAGAQPQTQPLTILKSAEITSTDSDLAASTRMQVHIRDDMNSAVDMINSLEKMRRQVDDQRRALASDASALATLDALDRKTLDVELQLLSRSDLNSDDKYYVERYRVYMNLVWLSGEVGSGAGDVAGGADSRPTTASHAVLDGIERDLTAARAGFTTLVQQDVPAFNQTATGKLKAVPVQ
ncbi:MAG: WD40/YVTN/BNR-like repeat-containing protein [Gemmatimonadaceae bacterium]